MMIVYVLSVCLFVVCISHKENKQILHTFQYSTQKMQSFDTWSTIHWTDPLSLWSSPGFFFLHSTVVRANNLSSRCYERCSCQAHVLRPGRAGGCAGLLPHPPGGGCPLQCVGVQAGQSPGPHHQDSWGDYAVTSKMEGCLQYRRQPCLGTVLAVSSRRTSFT